MIGVLHQPAEGAEFLGAGRQRGEEQEDEQKGGGHGGKDSTRRLERKAVTERPRRGRSLGGNG